MKLPLKAGLPLLALLLLGLALTEGREQFLLLVIAMGVALWTAFSLPHPGRAPHSPSLVERSLREAEQEAETEAMDDVSGRANGSGAERPPG